MRNIFPGWKCTQENQKVCDKRSFVIRLCRREGRKQRAFRDVGKGFHTFLEVPGKLVLRGVQGIGLPSWTRIEDSYTKKHH